MATFVVVYTTHKTRKHKVYHDGTLRSTGDGRKVTLLDAHGRAIDVGYLTAPHADLCPDASFELDRHLVTVQHLLVSGGGAWRDGNVPDDFILPAKDSTSSDDAPTSSHLSALAPPPAPAAPVPPLPVRRRSFRPPSSVKSSAAAPAAPVVPAATRGLINTGPPSLLASALLSRRAAVMAAASGSVPQPLAPPPQELSSKPPVGSTWSLFASQPEPSQPPPMSPPVQDEEYPTVDQLPWASPVRTPGPPQRSADQPTPTTSVQRLPSWSTACAVGFDLEGSVRSAASTSPRPSPREKRSTAMILATAIDDGDGDENSEQYKRVQRRAQERDRRRVKEWATTDADLPNDERPASTVLGAPVRARSAVGKLNADRRKRLLEENDENSRSIPTNFPSAFTSKRLHRWRGDNDGLGTESSLFGILRDPTPSQQTISLRLSFPSSTTAVDQVGRKVQRLSNLPLEFPDAVQYKSKLVEALHENLQVQMTQLAMTYSSLRVDWLQRPPGARRDAAEHEKSFRARGINLYIDSQLSSINQQWQKYGEHKIQLLIQRKQHSSLYNRDDLWIVSGDEMFSEGNTIVTRSTFFGPSSSGHVEMMLIDPSQRQKADMLMRMTSLWAIHVAEASSEFLMLETLTMHVDNMPLLDELLHPASYKRVSLETRLPLAGSTFAVLSYETVTELANTITSEFQLNGDQSQVLHSFAMGFVDARSLARVCFKTAPPGITLVHGVFGAGKSFLLAVLIIFLGRLRDVLPPSKAKSFRVMVSSATNVAVDRVLQCLLSLNYRDFVRVGSLKKIAKCILPFTANGRANEDMKELQYMLKGKDVTAEDESYMRKTLESLQSETKKDAVSKAFVVGATCNASSFPVLDGMTFPVVLLDECSQMVEPMSLVPVARFSCLRLVLIGDPQQLSPTLPCDSATENGLDRTLFERVRDAGHDTIMLGTQYRCHPTISSVCNDLFYGGRLSNGITPSQRLPLVDGLEALTFVNVESGVERYLGSSWYNEDEVGVMLGLVGHFLRLGITGDQIGIISLYKAQTTKVKERLDAMMTSGGSVQVSTVDAFQGAEKEIVLVSCVRTRSQQHDFIDSHRRINVAISRAKRHLIIVGHGDMLSRNTTWGRVLEHCHGAGQTIAHDSLMYQAHEWVAGEGLSELLADAEEPSTTTKDKSNAAFEGEEEGNDNDDSDGDDLAHLDLMCD